MTDLVGDLDFGAVPDWLFGIVGLIVVGGGALLARRRDRRKREWEQLEADQAADLARRETEARQRAEREERQANELAMATTQARDLVIEVKCPGGVMVIVENRGSAEFENVEVVHVERLDPAPTTTAWRVMPAVMFARSSKPRLGHGDKLKVPVQMLVEGTTDEPLQHGLIGAYRVVVHYSDLAGRRWERSGSGAPQQLVDQADAGRQP